MGVFYFASGLSSYNSNFFLRDPKGHICFLRLSFSSFSSKRRSGGFRGLSCNPWCHPQGDPLTFGRGFLLLLSQLLWWLGDRVHILFPLSLPTLVGWAQLDFSGVLSSFFLNICTSQRAPVLQGVYFWQVFLGSAPDRSLGTCVSYLPYFFLHSFSAGFNRSSGTTAYILEFVHFLSPTVTDYGLYKVPPPLFSLSLHGFQGKGRNFNISHGCVHSESEFWTVML